MGVYKTLHDEAKNRDTPVAIPYLYLDELYFLEDIYKGKSEEQIKNDILFHFNRIFDMMEDNWKERAMCKWNFATERWEYHKIQNPNYKE